MYNFVHPAPWQQQEVPAVNYFPEKKKEEKPHWECVVMDEDAVGLLQLHQHWGAEGGDCQAVDHQDEWLGLPEERGGLHAAQAAGGDRPWRCQHSLLIEHDPELRKNTKNHINTVFHWVGLYYFTDRPFFRVYCTVRVYIFKHICLYIIWNMKEFIKTFWLLKETVWWLLRVCCFTYSLNILTYNFLLNIKSLKLRQIVTILNCFLIIS